MRQAIFILLLAALILLPQAAQSTSRPQQYSKVSVFFLYNNWEKEYAGDKNEMGESVLGFRAHHIVNPRLVFNLSGTFTAASFSDSDPENGDISLSSLNDTRLKGTYYLSDRIAAVSVTVNLPTGKKELTEEEYIVAAGVADNSRKFVVRRFGQGLDIGGELMWLPKHENLEFQLGGGYLFHGDYQVLVADEAKYKYGNELYMKAGIEVRSRPVGYRGTIILKTYTKDEYDSRPVFQSGNTLLLGGRVSYTERLHGAAGFNVSIRGKAKIRESGEGGMTEEPLKSGRNDLLFYAGGSVPVAQKLRVLARAEYKSITANDHEDDSVRFRPSANYIGLGSGFGYQFSPGLSGSAVATYYTGKVDENNDLTGIGLAAALTFRYW